MTTPGRLLADLDRALRMIDRYTPPLDDHAAMRAIDHGYAVERLATELEREAMAGEHMSSIAEWEDGRLWAFFLACVASPRKAHETVDQMLLIAWHDVCREWAQQEAERVLAEREDGR